VAEIAAQNTQAVVGNTAHVGCSCTGCVKTDAITRMSAGDANVLGQVVAGPRRRAVSQTGDQGGIAASGSRGPATPSIDSYQMPSVPLTPGVGGSPQPLSFAPVVSSHQAVVAAGEPSNFAVTSFTGARTTAWGFDRLSSVAQSSMPGGFHVSTPIEARAYSEVAPGSKGIATTPRADIFPHQEGLRDVASLNADGVNRAARFDRPTTGVEGNSQTWNAGMRATPQRVETSDVRSSIQSPQSAPSTARGEEVRASLRTEPLLQQQHANALGRVERSSAGLEANVQTGNAGMRAAPQRVKTSDVQSSIQSPQSAPSTARGEEVRASLRTEPLLRQQHANALGRIERSLAGLEANVQTGNAGMRAAPPQHVGQFSRSSPVQAKVSPNQPATALRRTSVIEPTGQGEIRSIDSSVKPSRVGGISRSQHTAALERRRIEVLGRIQRVLERSKQPNRRELALSQLMRLEVATKILELLDEDEYLGVSELRSRPRLTSLRSRRLSRVRGKKSREEQLRRMKDRKKRRQKSSDTMPGTVATETAGASGTRVPVKLGASKGVTSARNGGPSKSLDIFQAKVDDDETNPTVPE
jgi:hypothetical protein